MTGVVSYRMESSDGVLPRTTDDPSARASLVMGAWLDVASRDGQNARMVQAGQSFLIRLQTTVTRVNRDCNGDPRTIQHGDTGTTPARR